MRQTTQKPPLYNVIKPILPEDEEEDIDFSRLIGSKALFTTTTNISKDGHKFSNITKFNYLYSDDDEYDLDD